MLALTRQTMSPAELDRAIHRANLRMAWRLRFWYPLEEREQLETMLREEFGCGPGEALDR